MNLDDSRRAHEELVAALDSSDPETIARAAFANLWPLYCDHAELLVRAVVSLPEAVLARNPVLRVVHPMTPILARSMQRPFKPLVSAESVKPLPVEDRDFITLAQMIAFRFSGDVSTAVLYAHRLGEQLLHFPSARRDHPDGPLWFFRNQIGSTLLVAGDSRGALSEFATAHQLGRMSRHPDAERVTLGRTGLAHAVRGSLSAAEVALRDARRLPAVTKTHERASRATEAAVAALISVDRMDDDREQTLAALGPPDAIELSWPFDLLARSRALIATSRAEDALEETRLAADAHPATDTAFAADVIASSTIAALTAAGEYTRAWRLVDERQDPGVLTTLAAAELALRGARFDAAESLLLSLRSDRTIGPGPRAEIVLLSGWLELGSSGELHPATAGQIARIASRRDNRRQLTRLPAELIGWVRDALVDEAIAEFDAATAHATRIAMRVSPPLTAGELRLLTMLPTHQHLSDIARTLHVSLNTVKSQLRSLYRKLDASSRDEAIRVGMSMHLIPLRADGEQDPR